MSDLAVARREPQAEETEATRASFNQACLLLSRRGRISGLNLSHRDFRVLLFLLGQKPGYFAHQKTISEALDSSTTPIRAALGALRRAGLVFWELIPPHHALPTGHFTRTNVNRYWVNVRHLLALLGSENVTPTTGPKSGASTQPNSDASTGKDLKSEQDPPSTPPPSEPEPSEPFESDEEAVSTTENEQERTENRASGRGNTKPQSSEFSTPAELEPLLDSWKKLKLGEPDQRSIRALVNRRNEGATLNQLEAAVVGADADEWLRRGRAKVPFAVVFATVASVERFAHEGRKILDVRDGKLRRERETRSEVRECAKSPIATRCQPPPEVIALCKSLFRAVPAACHPSTGAQVVKRSAEEEKARLQAWSRENGNV